MQLLWLLPSLGFGLFLGFASGQWLMAGFACFTFVLLAAGLLVRQNRQPIRDTDEVSFIGERVVIGFRKLPRFSWLWSPEVRARLTLEVLNENRLRVAHLKAQRRIAEGLAVAAEPHSLRYFSGFANSTELVVDLVEHGPHLFICGPTGSGKSQYLKLLLGSLTQTYSSKELQLITIDFKGGATLAQFSGRAIGSTTDLASNQTEVFGLISEALREREQLLSDCASSRIEELVDVPRLVVAVDELAAVLQSRGALEVLEAVAARGRSLGVHLVAAAQSTSGISRSLLVNLGLRVATGRVDPLELAQLGFKSNSMPKTAFEGMIQAQILGNNLGAEFSFPLITSGIRNHIHLAV